MNNEQFRKLILANSTKSSSSGANNKNASSPAGSSTPGGGALGSRQKSSIPMTPRSLLGRVDFARQLAEKNKEGGKDGQPDRKRFRTSAPKGSKFAEGYVDRARARQGEDDDDERAERLRALEKSYKDEEIDEATYERLRGQVAGGDLASTHLVKGLDFKLLERVRKGEDVFEEKMEDPTLEAAAEPEPEPGSEEEEDPDEALERLEAQEIRPVAREEADRQKKKGQFAPAGLVPGQKRSRDQILAEMKAQRAAAKAKAEESSLGSKFKKITAKPQPGTRIERDGKGREVMIIVDEDGNERRKVRKVNPKHAPADGKDAFRPDANSEVLGMEVPEFYKQQQLAKQKEEEEREMSIFDDVESDYDPLAGLEGSDEDESGSDDEGEVKEAQDKKAMPPPPRPGGDAAPAKPNYFKDAKTGLISAEEHKAPSLNDPAILATLRKARAMDMQAKSEEEVRAAEREAKLKKMLENSNRDDEDLDMGFGTNRMEDEADGDEETRVKLSNWGDEADEGDEHGGGGKQKRKRGGKKRKGDKESFADVMKVIQQRKESDGRD